MATPRPSDQVAPSTGIEMPARPPRAFAVLAHQYPDGADPTPAARIAHALAVRGIAVLRVDLGALEPPTDFGRQVRAVLSAVQELRSTQRAPAILIGHSFACPAVLAAAGESPEVKAVVTIGGPAEPEQHFGATPLLIMHAVDDAVVPIEDARQLFDAAHHPKSFVELDGTDHFGGEGAGHVAALIAAWAAPYLPGEPPDPFGEEGTEADIVLVTDAGIGRYAQRITAGRHTILADEPVEVGGADAGPTPYDLLLAALGVCTAMTMRMYADRKGLPLHGTTIRLRHDRIHAKDCSECETETGMLSRIRREIRIDGPLSGPDRERLMAIADRCPVHRTLSEEIVINTSDLDGRL